MAADPVLPGIHKALDLTVGHSEGRTNLYVEVSVYLDTDRFAPAPDDRIFEFIRIVHGILPVFDRYVVLRLYKTWISRTHYLVAVDQLLHTMRTPSNHSANGK